MFGGPVPPAVGLATLVALALSVCAIAESVPPIPQGTWSVASHESSGSSGEAPYSIIDRIPVGTQPLAGSYSGALDELFVPDSGSGQVSVVSLAEDAVVQNLRLDETTGPGRALFDSRDDYLFAFGPGCCNLTVFNVLTDKELGTTTLDGGPGSGVFDSATGAMFISSSAGIPPHVAGFVNVIENGSYSVAESVPVGPYPFDPTLDSENGMLYVPSGGASSTSSLSVINSTNDSIATSVSLPFAVSGIGLDPADDELLIAPVGSSTVFELNGSTNSIVGNFSVGTVTGPPVPDSYAGVLLFPCAAEPPNDSQLVAVSAASLSVVDRVGILGAISPPTVDNQTGYVLVPTDGSEISVISSDLSDQVGTIQIGVNAEVGSLIFDPLTHHFYGSDGSHNEVIVVGVRPSSPGSGWFVIASTAAVALTVLMVAIVVRWRRRRTAPRRVEEHPSALARV